MPEVKSTQRDSEKSETEKSETEQPKTRPRTRKVKVSTADEPESAAPGARSGPPKGRGSKTSSPESAFSEFAADSAGDVPEEDEEDAEQRASEAAFDRDEVPLPSAGLLSFYDRLRARIVQAVERKGGRLGTRAVEALLLVPDIFMLLVRLALDPEVPGSTRALIGGAIAYFVLPIDLLPEGLIGGAGYLDDLVLAVTVLSHTFGDELEPYAREHWAGPQDIRTVISDVTGAAQGLLGANVYERVRTLLRRRGVEVED